MRVFLRSCAWLRGLTFARARARVRVPWSVLRIPEYKGLSWGGSAPPQTPPVVSWGAPAPQTPRSFRSFVRPVPSRPGTGRDGTGQDGTRTGRDGTGRTKDLKERGSGEREPPS